MVLIIGARGGLAEHCDCFDIRNIGLEQPTVFVHHQRIIRLPFSIKWRLPGGRYCIGSIFHSLESSPAGCVSQTCTLKGVTFTRMKYNRVRELS